MPSDQNSIAETIVVVISMKLFNYATCRFVNIVNSFRIYWKIALYFECFLEWRKIEVIIIIFKYVQDCPKDQLLLRVGNKAST